MRPLISVTILLSLLAVPGAGTSDAAGPGPAGALIEAKRKAANDLMREGKVDESISLMMEVVKADRSNYRDFLLLARAYDKLNRGNDAADSYRQVSELLGSSPSAPEDRVARAECERRLKVLDAQVTKIRAAEDEFLKKLDALEREAIASKDMRAIERIFRLKAGMWKAAGRRDAGGCEVLANGAWQDTGVTMAKGARYRIRAAGYWTITGGGTCTADGVAGAAQNSGRLMGSVEGSPYFMIGSIGTYTAPAPGHFLVITDMVDHSVRVKNSGSVFVLIEPQ